MKLATAIAGIIREVKDDPSRVPPQERERRLRFLHSPHSRSFNAKILSRLAKALLLSAAPFCAHEIFRQLQPVEQSARLI